MIRKTDKKLMGIAIYQERKEEHNNLMELKLFCTRYDGKGLGFRLMSQLLHWGANKKLYSEICAMADIYSVDFFRKNEFILLNKETF